MDTTFHGVPQISFHCTEGLISMTITTVWFILSRAIILQLLLTWIGCSAPIKAIGSWRLLRKWKERSIKYWNNTEICLSDRITASSEFSVSFIPFPWNKQWFTNCNKCASKASLRKDNALVICVLLSWRVLLDCWSYSTPSLKSSLWLLELQLNRILMWQLIIE